MGIIWDSLGNQIRNANRKNSKDSKAADWLKNHPSPLKIGGHLDDISPPSGNYPQIHWFPLRSCGSELLAWRTVMIGRQRSIPELWCLHISRNSVDCLGCCWLHPHCLPHFFNYSTQKKSQSPLTGIKSQTKWGFLWKIVPIVKDSHSPFTTIGGQTHNPTISALWLWLVELSWLQVSGRAVGLWSPFLHFWGGQIPGRARYPQRVGLRIGTMAQPEIH